MLCAATHDLIFIEQEKDGSWAMGHGHGVRTPQQKPKSFGDKNGSSFGRH